MLLLPDNPRMNSRHMQHVQGRCVKALKSTSRACQWRVNSRTCGIDAFPVEVCHLRWTVDRPMGSQIVAKCVLLGDGNPG